MPAVKSKKPKDAWIVAADMGYGHMRAALPLKDIARANKILVANDYEGTPRTDKIVWEEARRLYGIISRFTKFPVLGDFLFAIFDKFQEIKPFYPAHERIDSPTAQLRQIWKLMGKKNWGKHLISKLNEQPVPLVTTFFIPAFMAEFWGYKGAIYAVVTDADVSRAWAPLYPKKSNIIYCVPTARAAERLARYGVKKKNIAVTGFPLPEDWTKQNAAKAKRDMRRRLAVLDPNRRYIGQYEKTVRRYAGRVPERKQGSYCVSLTFAIGGAGAQGNIAVQIMESIKPLIRQGLLEFHVVAGLHAGLAVKLQEKVKEYGLSSFVGKGVYIHSMPTIKKYFQEFNRILASTDVLWTKPSELVFYAGLGIPLLLAPPVGSQEKHNRAWILGVGAAIEQGDPELTHEWLADMLEDGTLAEAAMQGFIEIPKDGTKNIKKLVLER